MLAMQPATAGMMPSSDSEEESSSEEEEDKKPKTTPAGKPPRPAVAPATKKYASCLVLHMLSATTGMVIAEPPNHSDISRISEVSHQHGKQHWTSSVRQYEMRCRLHCISVVSRVCGL